MESKELVKTIAPRMIDLRRELHRRPELGKEEYTTTRLIKEELVREGIKILDYDLETGVIALVEGAEPGETVALRADIDALPLQEETGLEYASLIDGVMHACGHDLHTAIVLGAGIVLHRQRRHLKGRVALLFQPGEELLYGAKRIGESGVFKDLNIREIVGIHCTPGFKVGTVGIRYGQFMASSDAFSITVTGAGGHGAHPQLSVDPIVISAQIITALQTLISRETSPLDTLVISVCKIHGGTAFNIIPDQVVMEGTVRALSPQVQAGVEEMLTRISKGVAGSMQGDAEVAYQIGTQPLISDDAVVQRMEQALTESIGKENIHYIQEATTGSEDFSEYSKFAKIGYCRIGARGDDPRSAKPLHSSGVALDEGAIPVGMEFLATYAQNALNQG